MRRERLFRDYKVFVVVSTLLVTIAIVNSLCSIFEFQFVKLDVVCVGKEVVAQFSCGIFLAFSV